MSRLLRLYPSAWRERYEAEFVRLLHERPIDPGDSIDVILGAVDAHLHPELSGGASRPWTHRLPGVVAIGAGVLWSWYLIHILTTAPNEEWGVSGVFALLLMFAAVPGDYTLPYLRRIGLTVGAIVVAIVLARILPWAVADGLLNVTAGITAYLLVGAGLLALAAVRAGIGPRGRWLLLAAALLVPVIVSIPVMGGFGPGDPGGTAAMFVAAMPYGLAWTFLGLRMTARGSPTNVVPSPSPRVSEVPAT